MSTRVGETISEFGSRRAESLAVGRGEGETHAYVLRFEAGGSIGPRPAGDDQILIRVSGRGWIAGPAGAREALAPGPIAFVRFGEVHSKGSDEAMLAVMLQVREFTVPAWPQLDIDREVQY